MTRIGFIASGLALLVPSWLSEKKDDVTRKKNNIKCDKCDQPGIGPLGIITEHSKRKTDRYERISLCKMHLMLFTSDCLAAMSQQHRSAVVDNLNRGGEKVDGWDHAKIKEWYRSFDI
jgi:hypothetical protein